MTTYNIHLTSRKALRDRGLVGSIDIPDNEEVVEVKIDLDDVRVFIVTKVVEQRQPGWVACENTLHIESAGIIDENGVTITYERPNGGMNVEEFVDVEDVGGNLYNVVVFTIDGSNRVIHRDSNLTTCRNMRDDIMFALRTWDGFR